jgi:hypothetical protein
MKPYCIQHSGGSNGVKITTRVSLKKERKKEIKKEREKERKKEREKERGTKVGIILVLVTIYDVHGTMYILKCINKIIEI